MRRTRTVAATAALALAATTAVLVPAADAAAPKPKVLAKHLVSPLTAAIDDGGTAYVTQNFAGQLVKVRPGKKPKIVYASKHGNEVGGVSVFHGKLVFTETASDAEGPTKSWVKWINARGKVRTLANVRAFEDKKNPDKVISYGVRDISDECAAEWPTEQFGPATYTGVRDSHPYATLQTDEGTTFVADAGMNAVLTISPKGRIRTLAVLPAVPVAITTELADGMGLPACAVGKTYYGESVPTDVALGGDGKIYVTTEGGGLGEQMPLGSVYGVKLRTGKMSKVAGGLFAPVGIAIDPRGTMFVSQLFGGEIVKIKRGSHRARTFAKVNMPAAVEWTPRGLYATIDALVGPSEESPSTPPGGKLVRFRS
jgi:hypothetical protein